MLGLIYMDRFIQRNDFALTALNVHRVAITSVMVAAKFFDDQYYNNAYYAKVTGSQPTFVVCCFDQLATLTGEREGMGSVASERSRITRVLSIYSQRCGQLGVAGLRSQLKAEGAHSPCWQLEDLD